MPRLDPQTLRRFQRGDHEAFRSLVERHQEKLYGLAFSIIGNREDAEDILQEAFLRAYNARESFRGQSGFGTWLYRIVYNLCVDLKRRQAQAYMEEYDDSQKLANGQPAGRLMDPFRELEIVETTEVIRRALDELSIEQKTAIVLREIEGMSYKEMAKVMGCSKGTVMSRLHYGRKRLQERLSSFQE